MIVVPSEETLEPLQVQHGDNQTIFQTVDEEKFQDESIIEIQHRIYEDPFLNQQVPKFSLEDCQLIQTKVNKLSKLGRMVPIVLLFLHQDSRSSFFEPRENDAKCKTTHV